MTISLKHTFTSPKADGVDSTLVQPSNWNAEHTITLAAGKVLGRDTSSAGAMQELPLAFDTAGNAALSATGSFKTAVGTTGERPGTPVTGMFRFNSDLTKFEGYNGTAWSPVGGGGATISDTAPASPSAGDLWWNSSDGQMYTYYNDGTSSQWVVANAFTGGSAYLLLAGGTLTGAVNFTSGSAAAPSISVSGDTNTGIFFPAADTIALVTGGTEDFRIGSAGQFGIQGANYGTAGQVLTSGGAAAAPSWASLPASGVTSVSAGAGIAVSGTTSVTVSVVTTLGAVGTYAYLASSGNASFTAGTTYAGSGLRYSGFQSNTINVSQSGCPPSFSASGGAANGSGGTPSGTWQAMGTVSAGSASSTATLFIRTV